MNTPTVRTKSLMTVVMALAASPALAQSWGGTCGSFMHAPDVAQALLQQQAGMYQLPPNTNLALYRIVRVKVHCVRWSNGTDGIGRAEVQTALRRASTDLAPSGIILVPQDDVDYINDDFYYIGISTQADIDALRAVRPQAGMLNIYFADQFANEYAYLSGVASYTFNSTQGLVIDDQCGASASTNGVFSHLIGHYFDLLHTHETAFGAECVSGSNCATAGDLVCDTPADPCLDAGSLNQMVGPNCEYLYPFWVTDPCSGLEYAPDTTNIMSVSGLYCLNHMTAGQGTRALATLLNLRRSHLVASTDSSVVIHLDTSAPAGNGDWTSPINSFSTALASTPTGGTLAIARAAGNEGPVTLNRKMIIYNSGPENAVVRIGAP